MWNCNFKVAALAAFLLSASVQATACKAADAVVADGYEAWDIYDDLKDPRGIIFDSAGHALVVESGYGVTALTMKDSGNCVSVAKKKTVVNLKSLNHGIALSNDGKTLYASSSEAAFSWPYDPQTASATIGKQITLVNNMSNTDHTTRTLLMSQKVPGMLLISRGSDANIDPAAEYVDSGHAQIKAFNLNNWTKTYDFVTDGKLMGWGLRNDVGVAEEPTLGGIWSVENGVDQMHRLGKNIHKNNPGEKLNYLGTIKNNQSPNQGANFGYPKCFGVWGLNEIPERQGLEVGMNFAIGNSPNIKDEDTKCHEDYIAPRLVFQAHMAPLDIKFESNGDAAWVTFHGSWDRVPAVGYKVAMVKWASGEPFEESTSRNAAIDIVGNHNTGSCPNKCFRPVGLAWDPLGRLLFTSDMTGQLFMITKKGAKNGAINPQSASSDVSARKSGAHGGSSGGSNGGANFQAPISWIGVVAAAVAAGLALFYM